MEKRIKVCSLKKRKGFCLNLNVPKDDQSCVFSSLDVRKLSKRVMGPARQDFISRDFSQDQLFIRKSHLLLRRDVTDHG